MKDPDNYQDVPRGQPDSTSQTLLDSVKAGDPESRTRLVELYLPLVYHRYLARVPPDHRADVVQQVFATVFRRIEEFEKRFDGPAFRGWLYQIAYYKIGDYIRRQRRQERSNGAVAGWSVAPATPDDPADEPSGPSGADDRACLVRRALELARADFEPETYKAAWRVVIDGQSPEVVAAELGKSKNAVYIAKCRVLRRVRALLEDLGEWGQG